LLNPKQEKELREEVSLLNINGKVIQNQHTIANSFNDYFLNTAEKLMGANQIDEMSEPKNGAPLHNTLKSCRQPYPSIKFRYTSTEEIERIIKSLKTKRDMMKFQLKYSNGVPLLLVSP
jgi:hypothetical protein